MHITEHASPCRISIHALLAESDTTRHISPLTQSHFYPRSPCGERPILGNPCAGCPAISIHALLAESDLAAMMPANRLAIISIHALLAESDGAKPVGSLGYFYFYPRSPCGERRVTVLGIQHRVGISIHALLAESDCVFWTALNRLLRFLSTLSLRRATLSVMYHNVRLLYFYPRSPCGERPRYTCYCYL